MQKNGGGGCTFSGYIGDPSYTAGTLVQTFDNLLAPDGIWTQIDVPWAYNTNNADIYAQALTFGLVCPVQTTVYFDNVSLNLVT